MKTYIYVEDGKTQIVLTPENKFEKHIVEDFDFKNSNIQLFKGSFKECNGGWMRLMGYEDSIIISCEYNKSL